MCACKCVCNYISFWRRKSLITNRVSKVAQSCPTLCDPMDCSLPGSSVPGILQARILEWVAVSFSRESSQPRVQTQVSPIVGSFFTDWATREQKATNQSTCEGYRKKRYSRQDFPGGPVVKNLSARSGDTGLTSGPEDPTMLGDN